MRRFAGPSAAKEMVEGPSPSATDSVASSAQPAAASRSQRPADLRVKVVHGVFERLHLGQEDEEGEQIWHFIPGLRVKQSLEGLPKSQGLIVIVGDLGRRIDGFHDLDGTGQLIGCLSAGCIRCNFIIPVFGTT